MANHDLHTFDFIDEINEQVEQFMIDRDFETTTAAALDLDDRAGRRIYINSTDGVLAVRLNDRRALDYYAGFEYVDENCIRIAGDFVFYFSDDERVQEALDAHDDNA